MAEALDMDTMAPGVEHAAVGAIYEAALDPSRWRAALGHLVGVFDATFAQIGVRYREHLEFSFLHWYGVPDELVARYLPRYAELQGTDYADPTTMDDPAHPAWHNGRSTLERLTAIRQGAAFIPTEIVSAAEIVTNPSHTEVRVPLGLDSANACLLVLDLDMTRQGGLAVMRPPGAPPFNRADCDRLDAFAVHVRRALVLHERFAALDLERRGALQGLEDAPTALVVAGADARPLFINRAARRVLDADDGLCIERECLRGHDASATQHLHAAIAAAARASLTGTAAPGANLLLLARGGGESRAVNVLPLPSAASALPDGRRALALLVINDMDLGEAAASRTWREAFGITAAQARILGEVVRGADTTTIAARLGLAVSTVRTHLKALFRATGTHDQAALVRTAILARALRPDGTTPSPT